jgi:hypothetical protein
MIIPIDKLKRALKHVVTLDNLQNYYYTFASATRNTRTKTFKIYYDCPDENIIYHRHRIFHRAINEYLRDYALENNEMINDWLANFDMNRLHSQIYELHKSTFNYFRKYLSIITEHLQSHNDLPDLGDNKILNKIQELVAKHCLFDDKL